MRYLHTMVRVTDLDQSLRFYCELLGLREVRRRDSEQGRFTLVFLAAPGDENAQLELTYNWDPESYTGGRNFGHVAYAVEDLYAICDRLQRGRCHHPPAAPRRTHGVRAFSRWDLHRAAPAGRGTHPGRAMGVDGEFRGLVISSDVGCRLTRSKDGLDCFTRPDSRPRVRHRRK